nr:hypothetical protein [Tanacetum cinerariifolium]
MLMLRKKTIIKQKKNTYQMMNLPILYVHRHKKLLLADMFTKALPEDRFKYLVRRIGMRCLTLAELKVLAKESA